MPIVKCETCGKDIFKFPSRIKEGKKYYCSRECTKKQVIVKCEFCGKEFSQYQSRILYHKSHFCSKECKMANHTKDTKIIKCFNCGKEIKKQKCLLEEYNSHFCSKECKDIYSRTDNNIIIKENHAEIIFEKDNKKLICLFDLEDIDKIKEQKWHPHYSPTMNGYYVVATARGSKTERIGIKLHRLVTNCPNGLVVDHINHKTLDNRKINLRVCTNQENGENRKGCNNTNVNSGYRNVYYRENNNKWFVSLTQNGKKIYGGDFKLLSDAVDAAKKLRNKHLSVKEI